MPLVHCLIYGYINFRFLYFGYGTLPCWESVSFTILHNSEEMNKVTNNTLSLLLSLLSLCMWQWQGGKQVEENINDQYTLHLNELNKVFWMIFIILDSPILNLPAYSKICKYCFEGQDLTEANILCPLHVSLWIMCSSPFLHQFPETCLPLPTGSLQCLWGESMGIFF